jgi:hypothetical protein
VLGIGSDRAPKSGVSVAIDIVVKSLATKGKSLNTDEIDSLPPPAAYQGCHLAGLVSDPIESDLI